MQTGEWQNSGMAWSLSVVSAMLQCLWKIRAEHHQLAVGPGVSVLRTCAKSRSLRHFCVTGEGDTKPCGSQRPSCHVILHSGEMAQMSLRWGIALVSWYV